MGSIKSKSRKGKDAQHKEATAVSNEASLASETKKEKNMADTPSVLEFSEDVATAEAPPPLPVGQYPGEIRSAERKTSAQGNEYVRVQFFIAPEQYPADFTDGNPDGMVLDYNRVPVQDNPSARFRMRKFCEAIGYAPKGGKVDLNDWVGNTATLDIVHDTFEGETRAQIKRVVAP